jgi:hypothetical protein
MDGIEAFLGELTSRGHEPLLGKVTGRARLDLIDGDHTDSWIVDIRHGDVTVTRDGGSADCTIRAKKQLFDRLARGEANAMASTLRGQIVCSGDIELLFAFQRILPGPPRPGEQTVKGGR